MPAPPAKKSKECTTMSIVVDKEVQSNQEGMAPPEKKSKESTISMVVEKWEKDQTQQFSAVHRIKGYPWRLRLYEGDWGDREIELCCEKSNETKMWTCTATIKPLFNAIIQPETHSFNSWDSQSAFIRVGGFAHSDDTYKMDRRAYAKLKTVGSVLEVEIELDTDGEKWNHPTLDPFEFLDGILVIGDEKINVHKSSLASQSSFFDNLFFGNFKEKNMAEISIEDVDYEEFNNLLKIIYRHEGRSLTDENVCRVLHLAIRFDLKIVENVCVHFLLSTSSSLSIHHRLLISEENNLSLLKDTLIERYTDRCLGDLVESPEWEVLSKETTKALMKKCLSMVRSSESDFHKMYVESEIIKRRR